MLVLTAADRREVTRAYTAEQLQQTHITGPVGLRDADDTKLHISFGVTYHRLCSRLAAPVSIHRCQRAVLIEDCLRGATIHTDCAAIHEAANSRARSQLH